MGLNVDPKENDLFRVLLKQDLTQLKLLRDNFVKDFESDTVAKGDWIKQVFGHLLDYLLEILLTPSLPQVRLPP